MIISIDLNQICPNIGFNNLFIISLYLVVNQLFTIITSSL